MNAGAPTRKATAHALGRVARGLQQGLADTALVVFVLASLVFLALRLLPGDPAALVLGDQASPLEREKLRALLHLDESLPMQYARFWRGLVTLDLGESIRRPGVSALRRVFDAMGPTASLAGVAVVVGACLGVVAAVLGAGPWLGRRRGLVDRVATSLAATPLLAFAPVLTFALAARLRVVPLPGDPEAGAAGLLFASGLLSLPLAAHVARVTRAAFDDVARAPFLAVARAKGGSFARMLFLHALPASIGPVVTVVGAQLGALLGGAVVLERLFERRGLGTLILEAYASRDLPVLEGAVIVAGALFVLAQKLAAAIHAAIDPRART